MTTILENQETSRIGLRDKSELRQHVLEVVNNIQVLDVHTHLFSPQFGEMNLHGIDELLTYHYLVAELFRSIDLSPEHFWLMSQEEKADLIWQTLFVENTPLSEATRGVVTVLNAFGLDSNARDLKESRAFFRSQDISSHVDRVFDLARTAEVVMTNDPFDTRETHYWENGAGTDRRFRAALRMDRLLNDWETTVIKLETLGHKVSEELNGETVAELRRFLDDRVARMQPVYMAASLPDDFNYPGDDTRARLIRDVVLPTARERRLPVVLMIGVRRGVNPTIRRAGDGLGKADVKALERMCGENSDVRFMCTMLSRENQHELCVAARKFSNLMPFGCWWFLNNPSIIAEITRERLELLGTSFIPQHSDASVLEQLIYKWQHARSAIADALCESYERLLESGRGVTRQEIERDVRRLFSGNFRQWIEPDGPTEGEQLRNPNMVTV